MWKLHRSLIECSTKIRFSAFWKLYEMSMLPIAVHINDYDHAEVVFEMLSIRTRYHFTFLHHLLRQYLIKLKNMLPLPLFFYYFAFQGVRFFYIRIIVWNHVHIYKNISIIIITYMLDNWGKYCVPPPSGAVTVVSESIFLIASAFFKRCSCSSAVSSGVWKINIIYT